MITKLIIISTIVFMIIWDVVAGKYNNPTESQVLRDWGRDWTLLPFTAGFLLSHWFMPVRSPALSAWGNAIIIMGVLLVMDVIFNLTWTAPIPVWRYSGIYAMVGVVSGLLLWPQPGAWSPL